MSKYTNVNWNGAWLLTCLGNKVLDCLPNWHDSQLKFDKEERPRTIFEAWLNLDGLNDCEEDLEME